MKMLSDFNKYNSYILFQYIIYIYISIYIYSNILILPAALWPWG